MGTITLALPTAGTVVAAGLHSSNYSIIQALANGGIDNNNFAAGKIFDPSKIMQNGATAGQGLVWNGSNWAPGASGPGAPVTSLPGSPTDGQQVIFTDSLAAPTFAWLLQWYAAQSQWRFLGGSPYYTLTGGAGGLTSTTYAAFGSSPTFTPGRAGTYLLKYGAWLQVTGQSGVTFCNIDLFQGAQISTTGVAAAELQQTTNLGNNAFGEVRASLSAGTAVTMQYKVGGSTPTYSVVQAWIEAIPVTI